MDIINVAILGMGVVGQGVAMLLIKQNGFLEKQLGCKLVLKRICEKETEKKLDFAAAAIPISGEWQDVMDDPDIHIVVETIGGIEPAKTFVLQALSGGKHVVTANKDLLALYGQELFAAAREAGTDLYFEASVGGAIPILSALRQNLTADPIQEIMGIVNGTTNYILTRMSTEGGDFSTILADAQRLGYAEANPASDVEGTDAGRKAAILSTLAFDSHVTLGDVYVEGITRISMADMRFAERMGYTIKLLAICKETEKGIQARVHPALLPKNHPLSSVNDTFNAIFVRGRNLGDIMLYGRGAGRMPTASAILGDITEIARNIRFGCTGRLTKVSLRVKAIVPIADVQTKFLLRLLLADEPGVLAAVTGALSRHSVSLETVDQEELPGGDAGLTIITHKVREGDMREALEAIRSLGVTREILSVLRVEGTDD